MLGDGDHVKEGRYGGMWCSPNHPEFSARRASPYTDGRHKYVAAQTPPRWNKLVLQGRMITVVWISIDDPSARCHAVQRLANGHTSHT